MSEGERAVFKQAVHAYGTPIYVYSEAVIRERCEQLKSAFPEVALHYAVKANANPAVLSIIRSEGLGIEAVSPGELQLAKRSRFPSSLTSFTCASLTEAELVLAARSKARVHLDSLTQLEMWGKNNLGKEVSLRLNQGIGSGHHAHTITGGPDSKFGISPKDYAKAKRIAKKYGLTITSIHQHIGSGILDERTYMQGVEALLAAVREFPEVTHLDFGGGLGIPYRPNQKPWNLVKLGRAFRTRIAAFEKKTGRHFSLSMEPGRFVVAEAGTLLVSVVDQKKTSRHHFIGVNAGMNQLIRPAMYDAYHKIENVSRTSGVKGSCTVVGNICESSDAFATKRTMLVPKLGDVLAIRDAGAYGRSMASQYNQRPIPKEILHSVGGRLMDVSS